MSFYSNLLTDTAVLKTVGKIDDNGKPEIIALDEIDCRIELKTALTTTSSGEETVATGKLYTESIVKEGDILELKNDVYKVISVAPYYPMGENILCVNEVCFA